MSHPMFPSPSIRYRQWSLQLYLQTPRWHLVPCKAHLILRNVFHRWFKNIPFLLLLRLQFCHQNISEQIESSIKIASCVCLKANKGLYSHLSFISYNNFQIKPSKRVRKRAIVVLDRKLILWCEPRCGAKVKLCGLIILHWYLSLTLLKFFKSMNLFGNLCAIQFFKHWEHSGDILVLVEVCF